MPETDWLKIFLSDHGAVTATSVNYSSQPSLNSIRSILSLFSNEIAYYLYRNIPHSTPSAIVDLTGSNPVVLRSEGELYLDFSTTYGIYY